jgi:hypothetical protein
LRCLTIIAVGDFSIGAADADRQALDDDAALRRVGFGQVRHDPGGAGSSRVHDESSHTCRR